MSESVIADFVAKFNSESTARGEPTTGRVLLSQKRLVLAANDENKLTIPLSDVFDVAVGQVPADLGDFFDSTVTVAFERGQSRYVAAIEAGDDKIDKFTTVLFKALCNGTEMTVKHPARRGGRVTDAGFTAAKLFVEPGTVRFENDQTTVAIELAAVTDFDRSSREVRGRTRPVLVVGHMVEGEALTTLAACRSPRVMSILGRYLRLEYSEIVTDLRDVDLGTDEKELLVALYSGAERAAAPLADLVDIEAAQVTMLLNRMEEADLVVNTDDGTELTPKGQVVVSNDAEDVNV